MFCESCLTKTAKLLAPRQNARLSTRRRNISLETKHDLDSAAKENDLRPSGFAFFLFFFLAWKCWVKLRRVISQALPPPPGLTRVARGMKWAKKKNLSTENRIIKKVLFIMQRHEAHKATLHGQEDNSTSVLSSPESCEGKKKPTRTTSCHLSSSSPPVRHLFHSWFPF